MMLASIIRKRIFTLFILLCLVGTLFLFLIAENYRHIEDHHYQSKSEQNLKSILLWNAPDRKESSTFGRGHEPFVQHSCEFTQCEIVTNPWQRPLEAFDAIVINVNDFYWLKELPPVRLRTRDQRYVFLTQESPAALKDYDPSVFMEFFNWTMTYRFDSDILLLYGRIQPKSHFIPKTAEEVQTAILATHKDKPDFR